MKFKPVFPLPNGFLILLVLTILANTALSMPGVTLPGCKVRAEGGDSLQRMHFYPTGWTITSVGLVDTPRSVIEERDLIDVFKRFIKSSSARKSTRLPRIGDIYLSFLPTTRVSPSSKAALLTATNAAFYLGNPDNTYLSYVNFSPVFTFEGKFSLPVRSVLWADHNRMNLLGDWRYTFFPQNSYGLGARTQDSDQTRIRYFYLRFYQTVFHKVYKSLYFGPGYHLDYYYNIREEGGEPGKPTAFQAYGYGAGSRSLSSGISFNLLRDTRANAINPTGGSYANFVYRVNLGMLGSDQNWQSVYLDFRRYLKLQPGSSRHMLAVWAFVWSTVAGNPPYLDLPSIGGDSYNVTGRGYSIGRYRGRNMLYLETEYRFPLLPSGLLGGVLFANAHSVSEPIEDHFARVLPGMGLGLRVKLNRKSRTNLAMDFGWGVNGFDGVYFSIGEMF